MSYLGIEVVRSCLSGVESETVGAVTDTILRTSTSAYLYVTGPNTTTTIVGTLSGLAGGAADTGKTPAILTLGLAAGVAGQVTGFGLDAAGLAAGGTAITVDTPAVIATSLRNILLVGENIFDEAGVDHGTITAVNAAGTTVTRTATMLDGAASTAISNNDGLCVASELISVTVIGRAQNPQSRCSSLAKDVNVYSFALKPEEHQPSGTCNFSRIDTAYLQFSAATDSTGALNIYAVNYNVLRVMSGMGGLAYSN